MSFNESDYIQMKKRGDEMFANSKHNEKIEKFMQQNWKSINEFPQRKYEDIKKWQLERMSEIVDYAFENIPLYNKKYSKVNYKKGNIKTWEDFEKIPLLYKEELINGFPNQIVKNIKDFNISTRSSGSSGTFVTLSVDTEAIYNDTIQGIRQCINQSDHNYSENDVILFIYTCPWWIQDINGKYKQEFIPTTTKVTDAIETIKRIKPKIISTYPTYLTKLAEHKIDLKKYGVHTIIVHSEQSAKWQRTKLAEILNVSVVDEYSSEELTRIALECPNGTYHIEEDASYIEILDMETKKNVQYGKQGIVVGTNLLNTATPIIRYVQNDLAIMNKPQICNCGNNSRILTKIDGRFMDSIITPTNEMIPASAFMDLAYNWYLKFNIPIHGLQYQFIQEQKEFLNLYLIRGKYNIDLNKIRESVYTLIPKNLTLNIFLVEQLPKLGQKYRPVISYVKRNV